MADPYSAAARGIESGFGMAMRAQDAAEQRRRTKTIEAREAEEMGLRRARDDRQDRRLDHQERRGAVQDRLSALNYGLTAAEHERTSTEGEAKALAAGGAEVTPRLAARYGDAKVRAQALRQEMMNTASRLANGDVDIDSLSPKDLSLMTALATGFKPQEMARVPQAIKDAQAALATGNMPMVIEPMNVMLAPYLARGIGEPSAHGGNVVAKRIIRAVPAQDANGQEIPGHVYPILRVVTDQKGPDGTNLHYDAPMTAEGSTAEDDRIPPLSVQKLMDRMGNLGVATQAFAHPGLAARLAQGDKEAEKEINEHLSALRGVATLAKKRVERERVDLNDRVLEREVDPTTGRVINEKEMKKGAVPRTFRPGGRGSGGARGALQAKLDEIDRMVEDGEIEPDEATEMRKATVAGIRPAAAKGPNAKEVSDDEQAAVNAVASRLGLDYDPTSKTYRSRDGKSITPEQKEKLGAARAAIQAAARKAAGGGKRASPEELAGAAGGAGTAPKTVKWGDLK